MSVTVYGPSASGARVVALDVAGMRVIVDPIGKENNQSAVELAERIRRYEEALREARIALQRQIESKRMADALRERLRDRLDGLMRGRRRFFGPVVMVPADAERGWAGPVLLLEPEKLFSGRSLEFASAAEVHREHPELWVVEATTVGYGIVGVVLDAWGTR